MTNELTRLLSAGLDLLAFKILGKDRAAQAQSIATTPTPCVAVPPEQRPEPQAQQMGGDFSLRDPDPYWECLDPTDFAAVMRAHHGLENCPHDRRLEGVQDNLGWITPTVAGLVLSLWGPQKLGGHGKSTTITLDPKAPHPQAGIARNWFAEYAPEVLR